VQQRDKQKGKAKYILVHKIKKHIKILANTINIRTFAP